MECQIVECPKCGRKYCSCDTCPCEFVDDVIDGKYGNGEERKEKLGPRYEEVQNMVNEKLGYTKKH